MSAHHSFPSRRMAHAAIIGVLAVAFTTLVGVTPASAATLTVSPAGTNNGCVDSTYTTISSAIVCAANGDTINISADTYNERVVIDKNISLVGAGSGAGGTVIDGQNLTNLPRPGQVEIATSGNVTVSNLRITNAGSNSANEHFAIYARGVPNVLSTGTWTLSGLAVEGGNQTAANHSGGGLWCFSDFVSPGVPDNQSDIVVQNSTFSNSDGNLMLMELCTGSLQVTSSTFTQDLSTSTLIFSMRYSGVTSTEPQLISGNTFSSTTGAGGVSYNGSGPAFPGGSVGRFEDVSITDNTFTGLATAVSLSNNAATPADGVIDDTIISGNTITGPGAGLATANRGIRVRGLVTDTAITGNTITANGTGALLVTQGAQTPTNTTASGNRIVGNTVGVDATGVTGPTTAEDNWWGCNTGPGTAGCDTVLGPVDADPWLVLAFSTLPASEIDVGQTTTYAVTTVKDSDGGTPAAGVPHSPTLTFGGVLGTVTPSSAPLSAGVGPEVTYEAVDGGSGQVSATLDNATITSAITNVVEEEPAPEPTPTPTTPPAASPAEATRADPTFTG